MSLLYFRQARRHVDELESLMQAHTEAMDCQDCDALLQMIADAFLWINKADNAYRKLLYEESSEVPADMEQVIDLMFRVLLRACEMADEWINEVHRRGY